MSVLSDFSIQQYVEKGEIVIDPYDEARLQPASYDVALSTWFRFYEAELNPKAVLDTARLDSNLTYSIACDHFMLKPGAFALGSTIETIKLSDLIVARVEGKSSLGRIGLMIHATAGWIDPGFRGNVTLELSNQSPFPIILHAGMLIGQVAFMRTSTPVNRPYGSDGLNSKYQDSEGTIGSRFA